eukprot:gene21263-11670_t
MPAECRPKSLRALTNTVCKGLSTFALVDPTMPYIAAKLNEALIIVMKTKAETTAESSSTATSGGGGAGGGGAAAATVEAAPVVPHDVDTSKMDGEHGPYTWSQFRNYYYPNITLANKMWGKGIPVSVVAGSTTTSPALAMMLWSMDSLIKCYGPFQGERRYRELVASNPRLLFPSVANDDQVRVDPEDGMPYPRSSFVQCYGAAEGERRWNAAGMRATRRVDALTAGYAFAAGDVAGKPMAAVGLTSATLPQPTAAATTPSGVRDSGKAFQIIKALAIKRANGVFMRPTTASDVTLAWGRIAKYIASLAKKSSNQEAPPPPVAEVASRIWQLCLCRTTPEPQEVAAGLVSSGLARIVQTLPVPSALKILKGGSKGSSKASSKVQLECPLQRDDPSVVAVLRLIKSQIPTTLFDELPSEREVKAAAARDTATASSDGNGNAVWYTQPTRSSRRQARYWLGDVADEIENNVRLGTVDNIKVGTGARAKGVVGKMPFEKRKHQARCKDWEKKKESHARAHGGSRKKKCARTRGTIRC